MTARPIHRRPRVEQAVLRLLRGEDASGIVGLGAAGVATAFVDLAARAREEGLAIESLGAQFLSEDEHLLMVWLAVRQRPTLQLAANPRSSPRLETLVTAAARQLLAVRLQLPPAPAPLIRTRRTGGPESPAAPETAGP